MESKAPRCYQLLVLFLFLALEIRTPSALPRLSHGLGSPSSLPSASGQTDLCLDPEKFRYFWPKVSHKVSLHGWLQPPMPTRKVTEQH